MGERRYGEWAGNPKGHPEDMARCTETVWNRDYWGGRQCSRRRAYGPNGEYCKQHADRAEAAEAYNRLTDHLKAVE